MRSCVTLVRDSSIKCGCAVPVEKPRIYPMPGSFGKPGMDYSYTTSTLRNYQTVSKDAEITMKKIEDDVSGDVHFYNQLEI